MRWRSLRLLTMESVMPPTTNAATPTAEAGVLLGTRAQAAQQVTPHPDVLLALGRQVLGIDPVDDLVQGRREIVTCLGDVALDAVVTPGHETSVDRTTAGRPAGS